MKTHRRLHKLNAEASVFEVRQRAGLFARQVYGPGAEKALQREFDISESSAERILRGQASMPHINALLAKWGWRAAAFILEPLCGKIDPVALHRRMEAADQQGHDATNEAAAARRAITAGHDCAGTDGVWGSVDLAGPQARQGSSEDQRSVDHRLARAFEAQKRRIMPWGGR